MTTNRNALKAGLFIVVSIVLIGVVVVAIKGVETLFVPTEVRTARFALGDDLGGIGEGAEVRVGGVKVGQVRDVDVRAVGGGQDPHVLVSFTVPKKLSLRRDAAVAVQGTITGSTWLNIDSLGAGEPATESEPLAGRPSGITRLLATLDEMTPELKGTVTAAKETIAGFKPVGPEVHGLVADVRSRSLPKVDHTVDRAGEAMSNIRDIAGDTKTDFRETMANVRSATGDLKEKVPGITEKLDAGLAKVNASLDTAQAALVQAKETIGAAKGLVAGNRGRLDAMVKSLKTTGDNLKAASAEIRRSPWRLLYKPGPGEVANLNVYDAARQFAEGAEDVTDASLALRDSLNDPTADKAQIEKLLAQLEQTFGNFTQVEDKLWKAVKE